MSPNAIIFGPYASLGFDNAALREIRSSLRETSHLQPLVDAIGDLPTLFKTLVRHNPRLEQTPGGWCALQLVRGLNQGFDDIHDQTKDFWNSITGPITVLVGISQYFQHLRHNNVSHRQTLDKVTTAGCQGFCLGLLLAVAAAGSNDEDSLARNGAIAVRLAFCIGVYADLDQLSLSTGATSMFVLRRKRRSELDVNFVKSMLSEVDSESDLHFSSTSLKARESSTSDVEFKPYVATRIDWESCTIVIPAASTAHLLRRFSSNQYTLKRLNIQGRYHSPALNQILQEILLVCEKERGLRFPESMQLLVPVFSNHNGEILSGRPVHELVLQCILTQAADWHLVISKVADRLRKAQLPGKVLDLGTAKSLTSSHARLLGITALKPTTGPSPTPEPTSKNPASRTFPDSAVAIIGMACKYPGANSVEELWKVIDSGLSLCQELPRERFEVNNLRRTPKVQRFFANLIDDVDAFDHRFFHKTSREAASMDPQQRLLLEVAYQALQSANHFSNPKPLEKNIGCYVGVCADDYADNVASHPPNAFSTLGTLRAFLAGRISHHFGWTGESSTIDTACSSSAVAINRACSDIIAGKCVAALAGGVNVFTSPNFFQNLHAGKFLSSTGQCKSFDASADGYCRGEGVGLLVLKKLSEAQADGDEILAVIPASAVRQNSNETYITVPHGPSQSELYEEVLRSSELSPGDISYVEAHGTGTPIGDPVEFESIRRVFGGQRGHRSKQNVLHVGSIKANIGHTESASGVAAAIKAVLMILHRRIPPQANFKSLNPNIPLSESDGMTITTTGKEWRSQGPLTVCVNNYGASGSNAAFIVSEPPPRLERFDPPDPRKVIPSTASFPLMVTASSEETLLSNTAALVQYLDDHPAAACDQASQSRLADVVFNLVSRQDLSLPLAAFFTATSLQQLKDTLLDESYATKNAHVSLPEKAKPVILAFGGQVSRSVALDENLYSSCSILRFHLEQCQRELEDLGYSGLFPHIFQTEPIDDVVKLHASLFSLQYSFAKAWIDSGLKVHKVIGHSFGELTAMCVSGILSLHDGLKLVVGRAKLMSERWGPETGSMLLLDGDIKSVSDLVQLANSNGINVEVACHNGPRLTVISGSAAEIERVRELIRRNPAFQEVKTQTLDVPCAFHSRFTEPILDQLELQAAGLIFREPSIPFETCLDQATRDLPWPQRIRAHTRRPVFFSNAIQRLHNELNGCCWLEAGAHSGITAMARRALGDAASKHTFFGLASRDGTTMRDSLVQVTIDLWKESQAVIFWEFHVSQRGDYSHLPFLPPYRFEKTRSWLEWKDWAETPESMSPDTSNTPAPDRLLQPGKQSENICEFNVNTHHGLWSRLVKGHAVVGQPLCPAPLYVELAAQAAITTHGKDAGGDKFSVAWKNLKIDEPLGTSTEKIITLTLKRLERVRTWSFEFSSRPRKDPSLSQSLHAHGELRLVTAQEAKEKDRFSHYESALRHNINQIRAANANDTVELRGPLIYSIFSRVVTYDDDYKGVWDVVAKGDEAFARVRLASESQFRGFENMITNLFAIDNFVQVSGFHVNILSGLCPENDVFVCTRIRKMEMSHDFCPATPGEWTVLAMYRGHDGKNLENDIFVYDDATGKIVVVIQGALFSRVQIKSLTRALSRANGAIATPPVEAKLSSETKPKSPESSARPPTPDVPIYAPAASADFPSDSQIFALLAEVAEIDLGALRNDSNLNDLGIDSLLSTEILTEINERFSVELSPDEYSSMVTVQDLVQGIRGRRSPNDGSGTQTRGSVSFSDESDTVIIGKSVATSTSSDSSAGPGTPCLLDSQTISGSIQLSDTYQVFKKLKAESDEFTETYGPPGFWSEVYPHQASLVTQYVVEAFPRLGCDLSAIRDGDVLPSINHSPKHASLALQLYEILADASLVRRRGDVWVRTNKTVPTIPASAQLRDILERFPRHASEHKLLDVTGSHLADCITGAADPLTLVFRNKKNAGILEDVYTTAPFYLAAGKQLCSFLERILSNAMEMAWANVEPIQILEIGGGTASTTTHVLRMLCDAKIPFVYTFTDVAAALVAAAKQKIPKLLTWKGGKLEFQTLNVTKDPPPEMVGKFNLIISTNCVHATANLTDSLTVIQKMLVPDGIVSLIEFTKNLFWFDLVFGLMDGWWSMTDGRKHVLADEFFWQKSFEKAGFGYADWTGGEIAESNMLRIITGFKTRPEGKCPLVKKRFEVETIMFKQTGQNRLFADVYLPPSNTQLAARTWSVALLFHGGGHMTLSRRDINQKYVERLLSDGILPVSVDYRLCPEMNILEGPMADALSALNWARYELPFISLRRPGLNIGKKVFAVGWSSGGHLAMTLAWTAPAEQLSPPDAVLAFYSPSYLEHDAWTKPNFPSNTRKIADEASYDLLGGVHRFPITEHRVSVNGSPAAPGKWMATNDPRSTIILHANWKGQLLPIWLNGLPSKADIPLSKTARDFELMDIPSPDRVASISPHAQVAKGTYHTPTFIIHGTEDDLVPCQQSQAMYESLSARGIESGIAIVQGGQHLLDLQDDPTGMIREEVEKGFAFLRRFL